MVSFRDTSQYHHIPILWCQGWSSMNRATLPSLPPPALFQPEQMTPVLLLWWKIPCPFSPLRNSLSASSPGQDTFTICYSALQGESLRDSLLLSSASLSPAASHDSHATAQPCLQQNLNERRGPTLSAKGPHHHQVHCAEHEKRPACPIA